MDSCPKSGAICPKSGTRGVRKAAAEEPVDAVPGAAVEPVDADPEAAVEPGDAVPEADVSEHSESDFSGL